MTRSWIIVRKKHTCVLIIFLDLSLTKGIDEAKVCEVDSDENSCGDDSDFSDKVGIERRLIKP